MRLFRASSIPTGIVALGALLLLAGVTGPRTQAPAGPETAPVPATLHSSPGAPPAPSAPSAPWTVTAEVRPHDADVEERAGASF